MYVVVIGREFGDEQWILMNLGWIVEFRQVENIGRDERGAKRRDVMMRFCENFETGGMR